MTAPRCLALIAVLGLIAPWPDALAAHRAARPGAASSHARSRTEQPVKCVLEDASLSFDQDGGPRTLPAKKLGELKLEETAPDADAAIPLQGSIGRLLCGTSRRMRKAIPLTSGEVVDGIFDTDDFGSIQIAVTTKKHSSFTVHLSLDDQDDLKTFLAEPAENPAGERIELPLASGILCTMGSPKLSMLSTRPSVTLPETAAKDLPLSIATDQDWRTFKGMRIGGHIDSLSCRNGAAAAVEIALESNDVKNGALKTAEFGEVQASFLPDKLSIQLRMRAADARRLDARLAQTTAKPAEQPPPPSGEDFAPLDPATLTCAVPGLSSQIEDTGAVTVTGDFTKLVCRAPGADEKDVPIASHATPGILETKDFGTVQMIFSLKDFSVQYRMKKSEQQRLLAFLAPAPPQQPQPAPAAFAPVNPAELACPIPKITLWIAAGGGIDGQIGELNCHLASKPDAPVELASKNIFAGVIATKEFGDMHLNGINTDTGILSLAMKPEGLASLEQYLREYGIAQVPAPQAPVEDYQPLDPAHFSCHAKLPVIEIEVGAVVSGAVDELFCGVPGAEEKKIELASSTIASGVIATRDFGGLKFAGTFPIDTRVIASGTSFAMKPSDAARLEEFLKAK